MDTQYQYILRDIVDLLDDKCKIRAISHTENYFKITTEIYDERITDQLTSLCDTNNLTWEYEPVVVQDKHKLKTEGFVEVPRAEYTIYVKGDVIE